MDARRTSRRVAWGRTCCAAAALALIGLAQLGTPRTAVALEVGDPAPLFSARSLQGEGELSLGAFKGKVIYLDFWASWCPPCLTSLPLLEELRSEFPRADFEVLAINLDRDRDKARAFLEKHGVGYPCVWDPEGHLTKRFELPTMPPSFLIDRRGVIRHIHRGFDRDDVHPLRERIRDLVARKS